MSFFFVRAADLTSVLQTLKDRLKELVPIKKEEVAAFRKEHGKFSLGTVTIDQVGPFSDEGENS